MFFKIRRLVFMLVTMMSIVGAFVSPPATLMWRTMQSRATWTGRPAVHSTDTPKCDALRMVGLAAPDVVIEKPSIGFAPEKQSASSTSPEDKFKVMLFNDNGNTREYVSRSLVQVVGLPEELAYRIMMQANDHGMAQVGVWHHEMADAYSTGLKERGIVADVFPVE